MRRGLARAVAVVDEFYQERAALRKHLIDVPVGLFHGVEHGGDVRFRNVLMEKVFGAAVLATPNESGRLLRHEKSRAPLGLDGRSHQPAVQTGRMRPRKLGSH
jgi:hypothetical protein